MSSWQNSAKAKALKTVVFTKRKEIDLLTFYEKELHRLFDDSERISDDTVFAGKTMIILYSSVLGVLGVVPDFGLVGLKEAVSRRTGFPRCSFDRDGECLPDR